MRNYTNSVSGMIGALPHKCNECSDPQCEGLNRLRIFTCWNDLSSHLDENTIVHAVNRLVEIGVEYMLLKDAEERRLAHRTAQAEEKEFLRRAVAALTPQQILEVRSAVDDGRVVIVTQPMKSRSGKGGPR